MADTTLKTALLIALQTTGEERVAKLKQSLLDMGIAADKAEELAAGLDTELGQIADRAGQAERRSLDLATALKTVAGAAIVREFFQVNASFESMAKTLEIVSGSSEGAKREMEFVRAEANRLGIEIGSAASSYINLAASAKGTNLEGQATRDIWSAVVGSMTALGRSSADVEGAIVQLGQGISKGRFELEDLKSIAERIPGFFKLFADSLGVSTEKLFEMISAGELTADKLPALAEVLRKVGGEVDTGTANWARFKNTLTEVQISIGETGAYKAAADGLKYVSVAVVTAWEGFEFLGRTLANVAYTLATLDFAGYRERQKESLDAARADVEKVIGRLFPLKSGLDQAGEAGQQAGNKIADGAKGGKKAMDDAALAADALAKSVKAENDIAEKATGAKLEQAKRELELAEAKGNTYAITEAKNAIAKIEADLAIQVAAGNLKEAEATMVAAQEKYKLALAKGDNVEKALEELNAAAKVYESAAQDVEITIQQIAQKKALAKALEDLQKPTIQWGEAMGRAVADINGGIGTVQGSVDSLFTYMNQAADGLAGHINYVRKAVFDATGASEVAMKRIEQAVGGHGFTMGQYLNGLYAAKDRIIKQYAEEEDALAQLIERVESGQLSMRDMDEQARIAGGSMTLLGEEKLIPLREAISDAKRRLMDLRDEARDILGDLQDELDEINKNYDDIARRRAAMREAELLAQIAEAKAAGDQESVNYLLQALEILKKINAENIKAAEIKEKEAGGSTNNASGTGAGSSTSAGGGGISTGGSASAPVINMSFNVNGLGASPSETEKLARILIPEMQRITSYMS